MKALAILALLAACVKSNAVDCGFGLCPAASKCDEANKLCIPGDCGNGKIDGEEQCDCGTANGGAFDPAACATIGQRDCTEFGFYYDGGLACTPECTFDTRACAGTCGDDILDAVEQCDGLPPAGEVCSDFGFDYGRLKCSTLCGPDFSTCGTIGWRVELGMVQDALYAIWGVPGDLYAVGGTGYIMHSDGGMWTAMTSGTTQLLGGVWGSARDDVYAVGANPPFIAGDGGVILHYDGSAWSQVSGLPTSHNLRAIWGRSKTDIYAVGDAGTVLHFDGSAWTQLAAPAAVQLDGVWGTDSALFVVGTTNAITGVPVAYMLTSGWQTITVQAPQAHALTAVWGSGTSVFATGDQGTVLAAGVADTTWPIASGLPAIANDLTGVWGTSDSDVFFVGSRGFAMHFDGRRYEQLQTDAARSMAGVFGLSPREVHAATKSGVVLGFAGTSWTEVETIADPTQRLRAVVADASGHLVAVGPNGIVVERDPATGWAPATTILPATTTPQPNINSVWSSSDGAVFFAATGTNGGLFHRDAGATTIVQDVATSQFQAVAGTSKTDVWAVGGTSTTAKISNWNGTSWTALTTVPAGTPKLTTVWVSTSGEVFAAGLGGAVVHSNDHGATWTAMTTGLVPTDPSGTVQLGGAAADDLYLAGTGGALVHYDGTAWRRIHLPTFAQILSFTVVSPTDVYAFGSGAVVHYDGTSWVGILQPAEFAATGSVLVGDDLVMVGDLGETVSLFIPPAAERNCSDGFDDDRTGGTDCADPSCNGSPTCGSGGSCVKYAKLSCDATNVPTSTYSGVSRIDDLPCLDHSTPGPEIAWELAPPDGTTGNITVSITPIDTTPHLDLVVMPAYASGACALPQCTAATGGSVTFHYDGAPVYILVDTEDYAHAARFTLSVSCP